MPSGSFRPRLKSRTIAQLRGPAAAARVSSRGPVRRCSADFGDGVQGVEAAHGGGAALAWQADSKALSSTIHLPSNINDLV
eukprot:6194132-Pleurochrysis_carterae.AAC.11